MRTHLGLTDIKRPAPSRPQKQAARGRVSDARPHSPITPTDPPASMLHPSSSGMLYPSTSAFKIGGSNVKPTGPLALVEKIREPLAFALQPPEEEDDNWDDDFEEGISFTKLQGQFAAFKCVHIELNFCFVCRSA